MSKTELTVGVNWLDLIYIRKYNYRLEDHEGNEITVSELTDTCLSDPETCFSKGWDELEASDARTCMES